MIVVMVQGGLGNQMFQYAAGRALSIRRGVKVGLDTRFFRPDGPFGFGLRHFNIQAETLPASDLPPERKRSFARLAWRMSRTKPAIVREKGLGYNKAIERAGDDAYLHGYWQSERYFADLADEIRADFTFSTPPSPENSALLAEIRATPSVSLHVRRGDYAKDPKTLSTHGLCSRDYFAAAVRHVAENMTVAPVVRIFSDDPDWAEQNLVFDVPVTVVRGNRSDAAHEDMRLMAACRHHIIANSTFSWWGAWLNPSKDKIVVAPRRWFADPKLSNPDIIPQGWRQLDA